MKTLLDEQLTPQIARILRERGLDAEAAAARPDLAETSDRELFDLAAREQRAVVTNNIKDFRPLAVERLVDGRAHAGLILLPSSRSRRRDATGAPTDAIERVMRAHPNGIPDVEHWIAPF